MSDSTPQDLSAAKPAEPVETAPDAAQADTPTEAAPAVNVENAEHVEVTTPAESGDQVSDDTPGVDDTTEDQQV